MTAPANRAGYAAGAFFHPRRHVFSASSTMLASTFQRVDFQMPAQVGGMFAALEDRQPIDEKMLQGTP